MIGKHCGERLVRLTRDYPDPGPFHRWRCPVCGKQFKQRRRRSKKIEQIEAALISYHGY